MSWRVFRRDSNQKLHQNNPNRNGEGERTPAAHPTADYGHDKLTKHPHRQKQANPPVSHPHYPTNRHPQSSSGQPPKLQPCTHGRLEESLRSSGSGLGPNTSRHTRSMTKRSNQEAELNNQNSQPLRLRPSPNEDIACYTPHTMQPQRPPNISTADHQHG